MARDGEETLTAIERDEEWLSLRMRLLDGVDLAEARARLSRDVRAAAVECERAGLLVVEGDTIRLTTRGMLLENEVTLRLLDSPPLALDMVEC